VDSEWAKEELVYRGTTDLLKCLFDGFVFGHLTFHLALQEDTQEFMDEEEFAPFAFG
jgi:hypothetical protein